MAKRGPDGNRYRLVSVPLVPVPFVANTTQKTEIPNVLLGRSLALRVTGELVVAGANATGFSEAPLGLMKNISVICDGTTKTLQAAPAALMYRLAHFIHRKAAELAPPLFTIGTRAFAVTIPIDFESVRMMLPAETLFEPRRFKKVELTIQWGTATDIATAGGGGTIALQNVTSDIVADQVGVGVEGIHYDRVITKDEISVAATQAKFPLKIPQSGLLTGILLRQTRDALGGAGPVPVDTIVTAVKLYSDTTTVHDETVLWSTLQRKNVYKFQLDGGATPGSPIPGYAFLDRIENGSFATPLNINAINETKLELSLVRGSGTELVEVLYEFAEPRP